MNVVLVSLFSQIYNTRNANFKTDAFRSSIENIISLPLRKYFDFENKVFITVHKQLCDTLLYAFSQIVNVLLMFLFSHIYNTKTLNFKPETFRRSFENSCILRRTYL